MRILLALVAVALIGLATNDLLAQPGGQGQSVVTISLNSWSSRFYTEDELDPYASPSWSFIGYLDYANNEGTVEACYDAESRTARLMHDATYTDYTPFIVANTTGSTESGTINFYTNQWFENQPTDEDYENAYEIYVHAKWRSTGQTPSYGPESFHSVTNNKAKLWTPYNYDEDVEGCIAQWNTLTCTGSWSEGAINYLDMKMAALWVVHNAAASGAGEGVNLDIVQWCPATSTWVSVTSTVDMGNFHEQWWREREFTIFEDWTLPNGDLRIGVRFWSSSEEIYDVIIWDDYTP